MTAPDVVVVGGGTAGAVLGARLSEDPGRRVLVLEAGAAPRSADDYPPEILDGASLAAAAPGHPANADLPARLAPGREWGLARGRILGGSSAINGGYLIRPRRVDVEAWSAAGGPGWAWDRVLQALMRLENDLDLGDRPGHGDAGPVRIRRAALAHPVSEAVVAAAGGLGLPEELDKNAEGEPGIGPVPLGVIDGVRVNAAMSYLLPALGRPNLEVRGGTRVDRIEIRGGRAVAVHAVDSERAVRIPAAEVVLAAGALSSPAILLRSGIGPAADLAALGIPVERDARGVGAAISDHPQVSIDWRPARRLPAPGLWMGAAVHDRSDVELLPATRSLRGVLGGTDDGLHSVLASPLAPRRRGGLRLRDADPDVPAAIDLGYLGDDEDRRLLRTAARAAVALLETPTLRALVGERYGPSPPELADDRSLDRWIAEHLQTAFHSCGTIPFGPASDPLAVVGGGGRVRGIAGLRVADTSILPTAPRRGPALSALLVGELIADAAVDS